MPYSLTDSSLMGSKRPPRHDMFQQRLPAWQPVMSAGTVIPVFFGVALAFFGLGGLMLRSTTQVRSHEEDYTSCSSMPRFLMSPMVPSGALLHDAGAPCRDFNGTRPCACEVRFTLTEDWFGPVYFYYRLGNYFQSHSPHCGGRHDRRYQRSFDTDQLRGRIGRRVHEFCYPLDYLVVNGVRTPIMPCGVIANSLFNDTFDLYYLGSTRDNFTAARPVMLRRTGVAWDTDKNLRFRNPPGFETNPGEAFEGTVRPIYWRSPIYQLDASNASNNGLRNEGLMVWMRPAAFSTFNKLYAVVEGPVPFRIPHSLPGSMPVIRAPKSSVSGEDNASGYSVLSVVSDILALDPHEQWVVLPQGDYMVRINYSYPAARFSKSFLLTSTSAFGGRMNFLIVAYFVVGALSLLMGLWLVGAHITRGLTTAERISVDEDTPYLYEEDLPWCYVLA